ncbi:Mycobacterium terramassiliense ORFan, partial [Mycobacterium terramassiliense]
VGGPASAGSAPGPDGFGVSGMRTDATFWHPAPPVVQGPAAGSGVLTEVRGVTASVPPIRADATAPRTAILMTAP